MTIVTADSLFTADSAVITADGAGGSTFLYPQLVTNANSFYAPSVSASYELTVTRYDDAAVFYSAAASSQYYLTAPQVVNSVTIYSPEALTGPAALRPGLLPSTSEFYSSTVIKGVITLTTPEIYPAAIIYSPLASATNEIAVPYQAGDAAIFFPAVSATYQTDVPFVEAVSAVYSPELSTVVYIHSPYYENESAIYDSIVLSGLPQTLEPDLFRSEAVFAEHIIGRLSQGDIALISTAIIQRLLSDPRLLTVAKFLALK